MKKLLIGINGLKTSGKDTTYEILAHARTGVKRTGFADKLKIMAMLALGYDGEPGELISAANKLKEDGGYVDSAYLAPAPVSGALIPQGERISGREYLQRFGGHARAVFGESFWVDQVLPVPQATQEPYGVPWDYYPAMTEIIDPWTLQPRGDFRVLCVTDVRYPNEAQRVLDLGGEVWEVLRPGLRPDGHDSEKPLDRALVTRVIENDSDLNALRAKATVALVDAENNILWERY